MYNDIILMIWKVHFVEEVDSYEGDVMCFMCFSVDVVSYLGLCAVD